MQLRDLAIAWSRAGLMRAENYPHRLHDAAAELADLGKLESLLCRLVVDTWDGRTPSPFAATFFALQNFAMRAMPAYKVFVKLGCPGEEDLWALFRDTLSKRALIVVPEDATRTSFDVARFVEERRSDDWRPARVVREADVVPSLLELRAPVRMVAAHAGADDDFILGLLRTLKPHVGEYFDLLVGGQRENVDACLAALPFEAAHWVAASFDDGQVIAVATKAPHARPTPYVGLKALEDPAKTGPSRVAHSRWIIPAAPELLRAHLSALHLEVASPQLAVDRAEPSSPLPALAFPPVLDGAGATGLLPLEFHRTADVILGASVRSVAPPCSTDAITPWCVAGALNDLAPTRFVARWQLPAILTLEIQNATVFGRGLVAASPEHLVVGHEVVLRQPADLADAQDDLRVPWPRGRARPDLQARVVRRIRQPSVLLAKKGDGIFGHWLLDILPRIAVARAAGVPPDARWIVARETPAFARELLELAGIGPHELFEFDPRTEVLECERLFVPSMCRLGNGLSPVARQVYETIRRSAGVDTAAPPSRLLYVSRSKWLRRNASRRLLRAESVRDVAVSMGFEEVFPEELSMRDQVRLFHQARAVIGESGSGLHGTVFSQPGTFVLSLQARGNGNLLQTAIGNALGQSVGYVFGEHFHAADLGFVGDFVVDEILVKHALGALVDHLGVPQGS